MKTLILTLLFPAIMWGQGWVPEKVIIMAYDSAFIHKKGDTLKLRFDNYKYKFGFEGTGDFVRPLLIEKKKLYVDYYKAAGVAYFCVNMTAFVIAPALAVKEDKVLHFGAGFIAGVTVNVLVYKWTHNKWIAAGVALLAGTGIGWAKEYILDAHTGGVVSNRDWLATTSGAADAVGGVTIVFGHKEKVKRYILP